MTWERKGMIYEARSEFDQTRNQLLEKSLKQLTRNSGMGNSKSPTQWPIQLSRPIPRN